MVQGCQNEECVVEDHYRLTESSPIGKQSFFKNVEVIPLDTTNGGYIRSVKKVIVKDQLLYLLDAFSPRILIYNRKGECVQILASDVAGPNAIYNISDFFFFGPDNRSLLLVSPKSYVVEVNLDNGAFTRLFDFSEQVIANSGATIIQDSILILYSKTNERLLHAFSLNNGSYKAAHTVNTYQNAVPMSQLSPFISRGDKHQFFDYYRGELYELRIDSLITTATFIDESDQPISISKIPSAMNTPYLISKYTNQHDVLFPIANFLEFGPNYYMMALVGGNNFKLFSCNKKQNRCRPIEARFETPWFPFACSDAKRVYGIVNDLNALNYFLSGVHNLSQSKIEELLAKENPVIVSYQPNAIY